ncbi:hypothetical protein [Peribacillus butanolivorans]|uniref:hypothetical protein n=1 Tax=Peribacillus butanolivorans TaxID=421767 RepID=UPI0036DE669A
MSKGDVIDAGIIMINTKNSEAGGNDVRGYEAGFYGDNLDNVKVIGNKFEAMAPEDLNKFKDEILKEIEAIIQESKSGKSSPKLNHLIQFASSVGSASLVEILKSYGLVPSN